MKSKKQLLKNWKIYVILDNSLVADKQELLKIFFNLLESPVDAIQLRFENITDFSVYRVAEKMVAKAKRKNLALIINDRPEIALSLHADGVHLGKADVSAALARKILGSGAIIGKTIRNERDFKAINKRDVDYAAIGPVFATPLKPGLKSVSSSVLQDLCRKNILPLVAIGGINDRNIDQITSRGIRTVAFARYAFARGNTKQRIEKLRSKI
ncbi:MAG: thiamine phosphate synthase [Candidatus Omnitrophota bacterium]